MARGKAVRADGGWRVGAAGTRAVVREAKRVGRLDAAVQRVDVATRRVRLADGSEAQRVNLATVVLGGETDCDLSDLARLVPGRTLAVDAPQRLAVLECWCYDRLECLQDTVYVATDGWLAAGHRRAAAAVAALHEKQRQRAQRLREACDWTEVWR